MKRPLPILLQLLFLLALSACAIVPASPSPMPSPAATQLSRLPDPEEVRALLVQLVDVERRAPGIMVGMIAGDTQERWVVVYGRLSATDERVPDGDSVFPSGGWRSPSIRRYWLRMPAEISFQMASSRRSASMAHVSSSRYPVNRY